MHGEVLKEAEKEKFTDFNHIFIDWTIIKGVCKKFHGWQSFSAEENSYFTWGNLWVILKTLNREKD
jgi:hypothetical protein